MRNAILRNYLKESNLHVVAIISLKQNQYRIAQENNKVNFTCDNLKALRRFFATIDQVAGKSRDIFYNS